MCESASSSPTYLVSLPTMTPNSTSQSHFNEPGGITTSSFGPQIAEVAFMNRIGSVGTFIPDSAAWSEELSPMHKNLPTEPTQGPILGLPDTTGNSAKSSDFNWSSSPSPRVALLISGTTAERSLMLPC